MWKEERRGAEKLAKVPHVQARNGSHIQGRYAFDAAHAHASRMERHACKIESEKNEGREKKMKIHI